MAKSNEKVVVSDPVCAMMLHDYDDSYLKRKPWMDKLKVLEFEKN